jgi:hypothetical protein
MATEDIGTQTRTTDIARRQQGDAGGAHVCRSHGLLRLAHAPDERCRLLLRKFFGDPPQLGARNARDTLNFLRRPPGNLLANILHTVDAFADEFAVFPSVLENVPQHPPEYRNVGAGTDAHILGGMRCRARETRIDHDQVGSIELLTGKDVLNGDRMGFGRIAAHDNHRL